jgi:hypothetical protein
VDGKLHRVGRRLSLRLVTDSASSLSIGTGLAGTTTLPPFALPRFWTCYRSPGRFRPEVSPFALEGIRFQPSPAMQEFDSPLDGARIFFLHQGCCRCICLIQASVSASCSQIVSFAASARGEVAAGVSGSGKYRRSARRCCIKPSTCSVCSPSRE